MDTTYEAQLESKVDQLETELTVLNQMLVNFGFENGITTLKESLEEIMVDG